MFHTKYVMTHSISPGYFECNMTHGIGYDYLVIPKSPIRVRVDSVINEYPPFTAFYFPKETPYYYTPATKEGEAYEDCFIQFVSDDNFMQNWFIPTGKPIYLQDAPYIIKLAELIAYENVAKNPDSDMLIDFLMKSLILKIYESIPRTSFIPYRNELYELRQAISRSPEKDWQLADMAANLHISPGYLHTLYKKLFHTTCKQDVISFRLDKAKHLLAHSNQNIGQIAYACGYNNVEHFCRQFQRFNKTSPSGYRRSHTI